MSNEINNEPARHPFDRAGLGKPPYVLTSIKTLIFQACPGAPILAGGSCDYCATAIKDAFFLLSSDGKKFKVGCDCIEKAGKEPGNFPSQKALDIAVRKHKNEVRHAKEKATIEEKTAWFNQLEVQTKFSSMPHPQAYWAAKGQTYLDMVNWYLNNAGNSGKIKILKQAQKDYETA